VAGSPVSYAVSVEGLQEAQYVLRVLDPKLSGKLQSRVRRAILPIARDAQRDTGVGLSGISDGRGGRSSLAEQASAAAAGIKVARGRKGWVVRQTNKTGAIVEFAANGKTPQGRALVDVLDRHFGPPGRLLWHAADQRRDEVQGQVRDEVEKTIAEANAQLGRVI